MPPPAAIGIQPDGTSARVSSAAAISSQKYGSLAKGAEWRGLRVTMLAR
jgi:hypothetical protein